MILAHTESTEKYLNFDHLGYKKITSISPVIPCYKPLELLGFVSCKKVRENISCLFALQAQHPRILYLSR